MKQLKQVLTIAGLTFLFTIVFSLSSNSLLEVLPLTLSFVLLFFIILVGVLFDTIGVAAAAGREVPLNAMASNRISGSKQAIWLVRNSDKVATFCSDVVGDIAGTVSGAIGTAIIFRILIIRPNLDTTILTTLIIAVVAALTVGGKALGKTVAISHSTEVLYIVGKVMFTLEKIGIKFWTSKTSSKKQSKRKGCS